METVQLVVCILQLPFQPLRGPIHRRLWVQIDDKAIGSCFA